MTRLSSSALPSLSLTVAFGSILAGLGRLLPGGGLRAGPLPENQPPGPHDEPGCDRFL
jgi:hypothetical protein